MFLREKIPYVEGSSYLVLEKIRAKKTIWYHELSRSEKVALKRLLAFNLVDKVKTDKVRDGILRISYILKPHKGATFINNGDVIIL